jgi:hypothetical protein
LASITPVSLHNRNNILCESCVPNSISPFSMQMLFCQDWKNSRKILDTVGLAHGVCIEKKTHCILSEGTQVWTFSIEDNILQWFKHAIQTSR